MNVIDNRNDEQILTFLRNFADVIGIEQESQITSPWEWPFP
jgi:hypothetical protein